MTNKDGLSERGHAIEDCFFSKRESELLAKLKKQVSSATARQKLAAATGVNDQALLSTLQELGYDAECVKLLHLVPLIKVAWADGTLEDRERQAILKMAELRGVHKGSDLYRILVQRIETPPSEKEFNSALEVVRLMMSMFPEEAQSKSRTDLVEYSTMIASLSRKLLGLGVAVDAEERKAIEAIQAGLRPAQKNEAAKVVRSNT